MPSCLYGQVYEGVVPKKDGEGDVFAANSAVALQQLCDAH
jgi:hypothetical protein